MDAIENLTHRVSSPKIIDPGPSEEQWEILMQSALRAPDHGMLRPWRFIRIEGQGRVQFGQLLHDIKQHEGAEQRVLDKCLKAGLRAPLIVAVVAAIKPSEKIPSIEQEYSAAAAANSMVLAAHALGLASIWRSGWACFHREVCTALGLSKQEKLVGYIYIGSPAVGAKQVPDHELSSFVERWVPR
jgi:nitroreductase